MGVGEKGGKGEEGKVGRWMGSDVSSLSDSDWFGPRMRLHSQTGEGAEAVYNSV